MGKMVQLIIKALEKILKFLKNKTVKTSMNNVGINSLEPKILTDEKDIKNIQVYLDCLKNAIDSKDINNIAITGGYGSGKSTILKTFQYLNQSYEYLNISLASFNENNSAPKNSPKDYQKELEISILQQMFYRVDPTVIPDSRFKRIKNLSNRKIGAFTSFFIFWSLSCLFLFYFNRVENLDPKLWSIESKLDWITLISALVFFSGLGFFIKRIYRLFKNSKVNKFNIKGELELGESIDKSVFNQYIEEIIYFFERTKFNVLIIEDVDRFHSTSIFTKLREINILINNSDLIKRPINFVYAIKDEMFIDKNDRVKFFEYIIPVIPFVNPSNASEQLNKLIKDAGIEQELSSDFTSDIITFIDDIDMRLLINIFHEYQIFRNVLGQDLQQEKLFSLIVYKNLYPDDFGALQKRSGNLYDFFSSKRKCLDEISENYKARIIEIDEEIENIERENDKSIKELRTSYLYKIASKIDKFHGFVIDSTVVDLNAALEDFNFEQIVNSENIEFSRYISQYASYDAVPDLKPNKSDIKFASIEKEVSIEKSYADREKSLISKASNYVDKLKKERQKLDYSIQDLEIKSIVDLFELVDPDDYLGNFVDNNLIRNLLLNGHIDEHYNDYISLFHGVDITNDDFAFERKIKSGRSLPIDYTLTNIDNLIKRIPLSYFKKEGVLNISLIEHLIKHQSIYSQKLHQVMSYLSQDGDKQFDFILNYLSRETHDERLFLKLVLKFKTNFWSYLIVKSKLDDSQIQNLVVKIFESSDINSIQNFESIDSLVNYIEQMSNFFMFCSKMETNDCVIDFIKRNKLSFTNLDSPTESQNALFNFILNGNYYDLNRKNIYQILGFSIKGVDENVLKTSTLSVIYDSKIKTLISYVDSNISAYISNVMFSEPENITENEATLIKLLNSENLTIDEKEEILLHLETKIDSLSSIDDFEVQQIVFEHGSLDHNWENVFTYFDNFVEYNLEQDETKKNDQFDSVLISYLNEPLISDSLSTQKLTDFKRDDEFTKRMALIILLCNELSTESYAKLIQSIPYNYNRLEFGRISIDKIQLLIRHGKLVVTSINYEGLKKLDKNLHILLLEQNTKNLLNKTNQLLNLSLDSEDYYSLLKSKEITREVKDYLVKSIDLEMIDDNKELADYLCEFVSNKPVFSFNAEMLHSMFRSHKSLKNKISILNANFDNLSDIEITALVENFGENYERIFQKQCKPTFDKTPEHETLFYHLEQRELIIRYESLKKSNEFRVIAKYQ
jgi:hypothetical protein